MNLLALLLGLAVERLLTALFQFREFHWLDPLIDRFISTFSNKTRVINIFLVWLFLLLILLPVVLGSILLEDRFAQVPLFIFSVFVLLFCLGPRDLGEEVDEYRKAIEENNEEECQALAAEFLKRSPLAEEGVPDIEAAIYFQANNRIFGVVFWFALMGPVGAWMFRVIDMMRHRALYHPDAEALDERAGRLIEAVLVWHRVLAWVPSRLLMAGYALAGNYDAAVSAWRSGGVEDSDAGIADEKLLGAVGSAAADHDDDQDISTRAQVAIDLVIRTLWFIWCPVLALLTLYGAIN
jgi:AmpE protein